MSRTLRGARIGSITKSADFIPADDEVDGMDETCGIRNKGIFRTNIGGEKPALFPCEQLKGVSETRFLMGHPAERTHVAVKLGGRGMATQYERLAEDEKGFVLADGIDGDTGGEKCVEKGKAVEDLIKAAGGEGERTASAAANDPTETAPCRRAGELDDLLVGGIAENCCLAACTDQGQRPGLFGFKKGGEPMREVAAELRALTENGV